MSKRFTELGRGLAELRQEPANRPNGWHSFRLYRAIEDPCRFLIHGTWDSVEAHLGGSVKSARGQQVTPIISDFLAADEIVYHYALVEGSSASDVDL